MSRITSGSYFFYDDYIYFRQAQTEGLSWRFLVQPFPFGRHFSPAHRLADWGLQHFFPLNWQLGHAVMMAWLAIALMALYLVLAQVGRPGLAAVGLTSLYGAALVQVDMSQWWASGIHRIPSVALGLVCIGAYLRFHDTGLRLMLALSLLALIVALLFYEMPLLVPFELVLLRILVLDRSESVRATVGGLKREWRVWAGYGAVVAVYTVIHLAGYWHSTGRPRPGALARYLGIAWFQTFVPSAVGLPLPGHGVGPAPVDASTAVLAQLTLAGLILLTLFRSPRAWRAWAFFGMTFLATSLVIGIPEVGGVGPAIATRYRYYVELAYLFPVAVAAAWARPGDRRTPGQHRSRRSPRAMRFRRQVTVGLVAGALLAHLAAAYQADIKISRQTAGVAAGPYMRAVRAGLRQLARQGVHPTLLDGTVPDAVATVYLLYGAPFPYNRYSEIFPLIDHALRFDQPSPSLFRVGRDGTFERVLPVPTVGGAAATLLGNGLLSVRDGSLRSGTEAICGRANPTGAQVTFSLAAPLGPAPDRFLEVGYRTAGAERLSAHVDGGAGYGIGPAASVTTARGIGAALFDVGGSPVRSVVIDLPGGTETCLYSLVLGQLVPATSHTGP